MKLEPKKDGAIVTLPTDGTPYLFACCGSEQGGCNLVHRLYASVDSDGDVSLQVFRDEGWTKKLRDSRRRETEPSRPIFDILDGAPAPRKVHQMSARRYLRRIGGQNREVLDSEALDENGLLRDGYGIRVSLMDAQASRGTSDDARIDEAKRITQATMRGTGTSDDPYIINTSAGDIFADHKLGWRTDDGKRRRKTIYRDRLGRETGSSESNDSLNPTEVAYSEMLDDLQNAWRTDASGYSNVPGENAVGRALEMVPPRGGYYPASAGVGSTCNVDGRAGSLQPAGNGQLYCRPLPPIGATRADAAGDSVPRSMTAEEAQSLRDAAWREYVEQTQNAWKG
jgi:hypothetical protein